MTTKTTLQGRSNRSDMNLAELRYAPDFKIKINGENITAALRGSISSVSHEAGLQGSDRVEIQLVNENLRWLDHPLLALENEFELHLGYLPDGLKRVFVGEIVGQNAAFPSSGAPVLTIVAQDSFHKLQKATATRHFQIPVSLLDNFPIPDPVIMGSIALENFLVPMTDVVSAGLSFLLSNIDAAAAALGQDVVRTQRNQTTANFLEEVAKSNGMDVLIEHDGKLAGKKLRFMSTFAELEPDVKLSYGKSLLDFSPRITNVGQIAGVTLRVWASEIKTRIAISLYWDWDKQRFELRVQPGFGPPVSRGANVTGEGGIIDSNGGIVDVINKPAKLSTAPRIIIEHLLPKLNNRLTASGGCVGKPTIKPGSVIEIGGVGKLYGGRYRVTKVKHNLDSGGYRTQFELQKHIAFGAIPAYKKGAAPIHVQGQSPDSIVDKVKEKSQDIVDNIRKL